MMYGIDKFIPEGAVTDPKKIRRFYSAKFLTYLSLTVVINCFVEDHKAFANDCPEKQLWLFVVGFVKVIFTEFNYTFNLLNFWRVKSCQFTTKQNLKKYPFTPRHATTADFSISLATKTAFGIFTLYKGRNGKKIWFFFTNSFLTI